MNKIFRGDASDKEDDSLGWSAKFTLDEPCHEEAFEEKCGEDVMVRGTPSTNHTYICSEPLNSMPILTPLLPTTPSQFNEFHKSLRDIKGYYPSLNPYCVHLEDVF